MHAIRPPILRHQIDAGNLQTDQDTSCVNWRANAPSVARGTVKIPKRCRQMRARHRGTPGSWSVSREYGLSTRRKVSRSNCLAESTAARA